MHLRRSVLAIVTRVEKTERGTSVTTGHTVPQRAAHARDMLYKESVMMSISENKGTVCVWRHINI
jgi:hypothetical protein